MASVGIAPLGAHVSLAVLVVERGEADGAGAEHEAHEREQLLGAVLHLVGVRVRRVGVRVSELGLESGPCCTSSSGASETAAPRKM